MSEQINCKDMDDTEEGEILEDGEIADEDETTPIGDHKTGQSTPVSTDMCTHKMY